MLRGQKITSIKSLASEVGLSEMKIRTSLNKLKSTGEITIETTNRSSLITICKYREFQGDSDPDNKPDNKPRNKQITNKQQTDNKQITTNKKGRRGECENENINSDKSGDVSSACWSDTFAPEVVSFVEVFQGGVVETHGKKAPKITRALLKNCASTVDKLSRIDGHSFDTVRTVLRWAANDEFWSSNAMSLAGLRKKGPDGRTKFQKILAAYERGGRSGSGGGGGKPSIVDVPRFRPEDNEDYHNNFDIPF